MDAENIGVMQLDSATLGELRIVRDHVETRKSVGEHALVAHAMAEESLGPIKRFANLVAEMSTDSAEGKPTLIHLGEDKTGTSLFVEVDTTDRHRVMEAEYSFSFYAGVKMPEEYELPQPAGDVLRDVKPVGYTTDVQVVVGVELHDAYESTVRVTDGYNADQFADIDEVEGRKTESIDRVTELNKTIEWIAASLLDPELNPDITEQYPEVLKQARQIMIRE